MTKSRWNKLQIGDVLENERSRKKFVVINVERVVDDKTQKPRILSVRLERFLIATDNQQWRCLTKQEIKNETW